MFEVIKGLDKGFVPDFIHGTFTIRVLYYTGC